MHNNYSEVHRNDASVSKLNILILHNKIIFLFLWWPWIVALDVLNCISPPSPANLYRLRRLESFQVPIFEKPCRWLTDWHLGFSHHLYLRIFSEGPQIDIKDFQQQQILHKFFNCFIWLAQVGSLNKPFQNV